MASRSELLECLKELSPAQFEEVLFFLKIDPAIIPSPCAEQIIRAIRVIQRLEQEQDGLECLERTLAEPAISIIGEQYIGYEIEAQVKQIVSEYTQQPFEGREEEKRQLDEFVMNNSSGVLLVTAAAGFGKSALLSHWQQTRQEDYFIAYHCFSYRYEKTRSVSEAYRNLLKQLYLYYNIRNGQFPNDENGMRDILVGMLRQPVSSEGKRLLIVLDGLDEAEKTFEPFFTCLPDGVFVTASARAEEEDEPKYLLNWTDNAQRLALKRLRHEAIPKWLEKISELANYSQDEEFVKSLDETTGGFPLYLRYLIDDLRQAATQSQDVRKVLAQTPKGFEGYVEQQLKRLDELDLPEQRWQFFALLAVAKGVLEKEDIKALTQMRDRDLRQLRQSWQVTRWMQITEDKFYAFAHPLLAKTFGDKLGDDAEDALQDLINYCARWQKHHSAYALRHYAEHLGKAKRWEELYRLARNPDFASAQQQQLPDEPDLSLKTVQTALLGAAEEDKAERMAEFLLVHAHRLGQTTALESPLEALRAGSLERALTLTGLYDVEICVLWYLLLAWALKEQSRCEEARETLEQLQHKKLPRLSDWQGDYAAYLLTCVFEVSEDVFLALHKQILNWRSLLDLCKNLTEGGYFTIVLSAAQSIDVEWARIQALGEVAVALARAGDFTTALNTIDELLSEQKKLWLGKIAVAIAVVGDFDLALSTAQQIDDKAEQAKALGEIAQSTAIAGDQELSQSTFNTALKTALSINDRRQQVRVLWEIAKSIAIAGNTKVARSTLDTALEITQLIAYHQQHEREYELGEIAAVIAITGDYNTALKLSEQINDQRLNSLALVNIVKAIARAGNFPLALNIANQIRDGVEQTRALGKIVKAMAGAGDFTTALKTSQQINSEAEYTWVLVEVAQKMAQSGDFTAALKTASHISPDYNARFTALGKIAIAMVAAGEKEAAIFTFKTALETISSIENEWQRQKHLGEIVQEKLKNASILGAEVFARVREKLVTQLIVTEEDFAPALENAHQFQDERHKAWALTEIAEKMALVGLSEQALKTVMMALINRNWFLPRVASIFVKTGDRENLKQLLIPCAHYLYAAYQMSGYLARLYPEKAEEIAKVLSGLD